MPFSEATITSYLPPVWNGFDLTLAWTSTSPAGTIYQCYIDGAMVYHGTNLFCVIPMPSAQIDYVVGTVGPGEGTTNFSADLPAVPATKAELTWYGGTCESTSISGFYLYSSDNAGDPIDYTNSVANISAYTGPPTDGWNLGPWNVGGWGEDAASYSWTSNPLASGTWNFAVLPYDAAGNIGSGANVSVYIQAPPIEVAPFGDMTRLRYAYNPSNQEVTLTWNASPSA